MTEISLDSLHRGLAAEHEMARGAANCPVSPAQLAAVAVLSLLTCFIAGGIYGVYYIVNNKKKQAEFRDMAKDLLKQLHANENYKAISADLTVPGNRTLKLTNVGDNLKLELDGEQTTIENCSIERLAARIACNMLAESTQYGLSSPDFQLISTFHFSDTTLSALDEVDAREFNTNQKSLLGVPHEYDGKPLHEYDGKPTIKFDRVDERSASKDVFHASYDQGAGFYLKPTTGNPIVTASIVAGISSTDPMYAQRSILTYFISRQLGFDVIPETGILRVPGQNGEFYAIKEAPGKAALDLNKAEAAAVANSNTLIKQLIALQLVDFTTGQLDRGPRNYFVDLKNQKISGIDNDQCAGRLTTSQGKAVYCKRVAVVDQQIIDLAAALGMNDVPKALLAHVMRDWQASGFRGVWLPPVLDVEMVESIKLFTQKRAENIERMQEMGFTADEVEAAGKRIDALAEHVRVLEARQAENVLSIIKPEHWTNKDTLERLSPSHRVLHPELELHTNYLTRDILEQASARLPNQF